MKPTSKPSTTIAPSNTETIGHTTLRPKSRPAANSRLIFLESMHLGAEAEARPQRFGTQVPICGGSLRAKAQASRGLSTEALQLRRRVHDLVPRRFRLDEDVCCWPDSRRIDERSQRHMREQALTNDRKQQGATTPAADVVRTFAA